MRLDLAFVHAHQAFDQRKAQHQPASCAVGRLPLYLVEQVEDAVQRLGRDAMPLSVTSITSCLATRRPDRWMRPPTGV